VESDAFWMFTGPNEEMVVSALQIFVENEINRATADQPLV
jgi:hypothetical protein